MSFFHVVATRMGIGVYDEAWFQMRLRLFSAITLPSMISQSCQDFHWLIVIDQHMPPFARATLEEAVSAVPNIVLIEAEFKKDFRYVVSRWIRKRSAELGASTVLTSRLDDDDALCSGAFAALHKAVRHFEATSTSKYGVFSFNLGSMWLPSHRRAYTRYHHSIGIGLSLLEPVEDCSTVYGRPHLDIKLLLASHGTYFHEFAGDTPWWLYTTHNLSDSESGDFKRATKILNHKRGYEVDDAMLARFGLDPSNVDSLRDLGSTKPNKPLFRLSTWAISIEKEIATLRAARAEAQNRDELARIEQELKQLEKARRDAGSQLL